MLPTLRARGFYLGEQLDEFLFALGLVVAALGFGELRDVHGAEFRPTHGAELGFFVKVVGQVFVVHGFGCRWIERKLELLVPVEQEARIRQRVVTIARTGTVASNIRG